MFLSLLFFTDNDNMLVLKAFPNLDKCETEYVNASYIDV